MGVILIEIVFKTRRINDIFSGVSADGKEKTKIWVLQPSQTKIYGDVIEQVRRLTRNNEENYSESKLRKCVKKEQLNLSNADAMVSIMRTETEYKG